MDTNTDRRCAEPSVPVTCAGGWRRERDSVQQPTEGDWVKRGRDFKCAERSKTRQPSYVPVTLAEVGNLFSNVDTGVANEK